MQQARPKFTEAELLDLLAILDDTMEGVGVENVRIEEQPSAWDPSVNVVLDGSIFMSENDFKQFMKSLTSVDSAAAPGEQTTGGLFEPHAGAKRATMSTPTQRPKRCRKTPKQEIDHLRAVAAELEKKLRNPNQTHNQSNVGSDPFWKRVSSRLLEQRQKSAVENARLRGLVREQMATLKALQRSLEKTAALSPKDVLPEPEETTMVPDQPKELYRDLFRNLSTLYSTGVDTMLPQCSTPSPSLGGSKKVNIEIETDNNDGLRMCLQVMENKLVPFSFEKIREEAWKILTGTNGHANFELVRRFSSSNISLQLSNHCNNVMLCKAVQNQGDEMFGWCRLDNAVGSMQMLGNVAVRQYVEANKLTIIWECEGDVHQGDSKTRIQPKGWCVFEPAEEDPANATIFRRCAILSPIIPEDTNLEGSIGTTTELVLENYKRSVVYIFDGMLASLNDSSVS